MTPLETITAVGTVTKTIASIAQGVKSTELNNRIIELQQLIFELQGHVASQQEELHALRERNRSLTRSRDIEAELTYEETMYWRKAEGKIDGPFCPSCWDVDGKLVRLHPTPHQRGAYYCSVHRNTFTTSDFTGFPYEEP